MTAVRFYVDDERAGRLFARATTRLGDRVREAARKSAADAAGELQEKIADDISAAGRFGQRWTEGFEVNVTEGGGNIRVEVDTEKMPPYWRIFQTGGTIKGDPLLWIPLSIFGSDAQGVRARDYPGRLFRVDREGKAPLLLTPGAKKGDKAMPVYFGKESVYEPKKFHVDEIVRDEAKKMPDRFKQNMKASENG